jgi:hypothetical protein
MCEDVALIRFSLGIDLVSVSPLLADVAIPLEAVSGNDVFLCL